MSLPDEKLTDTALILTLNLIAQENENGKIRSDIMDYFKNKDVEIFVKDEEKSPSNEEIFIRVHPSLLPAFAGENAIERAFESGVKVSGVTVLNGDKIVAQYPVLIGLETHLDEFKKDIIDIEKRLVPAVIEAILEDRVFDFLDLFRSSCSRGGCGGCHGCG